MRLKKGLSKKIEHKIESMPISKTFKTTIKQRADRDPEFRKALLVEGVQSLLNGDVNTGKAILRDYINATIGFKKLGELVAKQPKSLMRSLSETGNPTSENLLTLIATLQKTEGIQFEIGIAS